MEVFHRQFDNLDTIHYQELQVLEIEGVMYEYLWEEGAGEYVQTRLRLKPAEIVSYVEALTAYDEFEGLYKGSGDPVFALKNLSDSKIRRQVEAYNEWAIAIGQRDTMFCLAAFIGGHLENLLCSIVPGRHEILAQSYSGDRRFLLREILEMFPQSVSQLASRMGNRPAYNVQEEQDIRDLLFAIVKCVFPDAKIEEYTSIHAGGTKRIDIVIPMIATIIEVKHSRNPAHGKKVADELKVDFESYHVHPSCKTLFAFVWDPNWHIPDRQNFSEDLRGPRTKGNSHFNVEVIVKP